jgi:NitT/TauT family transport system substrate-binding protein
MSHARRFDRQARLQARIHAGLVAFAATLCGFIAASGAASAQTLENVSLRMDWVISAYHAPYFVGVKNGFYKAEGLNVTIEPGNGSATVAQAVGNGQGNFGTVDGGTMMQLVSKGLPVKSVMGLYQRNPIGVIYTVKSGVTKPKDLEGKTLVVTHGDAPSALLPAFFKATKVDPAKVKVISVDAASKNAAVISGRADAVVTFNFLAIPLIESAGVKMKSFDFADYGVNVPGITLIAPTSYIEKNPETVRKFVHATAKAFEWSIANPQKAIDILVAANPNQKINTATALSVLKGSFALLHTKRTEGKPVGVTDPQDWADAEKILVEYFKINKVDSPSHYFTNEFVAAK